LPDTGHSNVIVQLSIMFWARRLSLTPGSKAIPSHKYSLVVESQTLQRKLIPIGLQRGIFTFSRNFFKNLRKGVDFKQIAEYR